MLCEKDWLILGVKISPPCVSSKKSWSTKSTEKDHKCKHMVVKRGSGSDQGSEGRAESVTRMKEHIDSQTGHGHE